MASPAVFNFTDGTSGNIYHTGFLYPATTGWGSCQLMYSPISGAEKRAYFQFNTASIEDTATVTLVELKLIDALAQPLNQIAACSVYMGDIIGAVLNGTVTEFNAGTRVDSSYSFSSGTYIDIGVAAKGYVSLTGVTDIKLVGLYWGRQTEGKNFNQSKNKSQLRVTYTLPSGGGQVIKVFESS